MLCFEPNKDLKKLACAKINYVEKYIPIEFEQSFARTIHKISLIKAKCWEYESEYRGFRYESGVCNYLPEALKSITLGLKFPKDKIEELKKIARRNNRSIIIYKTVIIKKTLELKMEII